MLLIKCNSSYTIFVIYITMLEIHCYKCEKKVEIHGQYAKVYWFAVTVVYNVTDILILHEYWYH